MIGNKLIREKNVMKKWKERLERQSKLNRAAMNRAAQEKQSWSQDLSSAFQQSTFSLVPQWLRLAMEISCNLRESE